MTTKTFWELLDDPVCGICKGTLIVIDDATFYCPQCKERLTLCGSHGTCEGVAYEGPYTHQNGELTEAGNLTDGCCETCGEGWELA